MFHEIEINKAHLLKILYYLDVSKNTQISWKQKNINNIGKLIIRFQLLLLMPQNKALFSTHKQNNLVFKVSRAFNGKIYNLPVFMILIKPIQW